MIGSHEIGHGRTALDATSNRLLSAPGWVALVIGWVRDIAASWSSGSSQFGPQPEQVIGRATGTRT